MFLRLLLKRLNENNNYVAAISILTPIHFMYYFLSDFAPITSHL